VARDDDQPLQPTVGLTHKNLDAAVCDSYGWPHDLADEEVLERLLALNLERADLTLSKGARIEEQSA